MLHRWRLPQGPLPVLQGGRSGEAGKSVQEKFLGCNFALILCISSSPSAPASAQTFAASAPRATSAIAAVFPVPSSAPGWGDRSTASAATGWGAQEARMMVRRAAVETFYCLN